VLSGRKIAERAAAQTRPTTLAQALNLYRGPFLEGFALPDCPEFEAWLALERSAWERRCDDALAGRVPTWRHIRPRSPLWQAH